MTGKLGHKALLILQVALVHCNKCDMIVSSDNFDEHHPDIRLVMPEAQGHSSQNSVPVVNGLYRQPGT